MRISNIRYFPGDASYLERIFSEMPGAPCFCRLHPLSFGRALLLLISSWNRMCSKSGRLLKPASICGSQTTLFNFPSGSSLKNPLAMQETWVQSLGWEDLLGKKGQSTPVFLPGKIPQTEEPGGLWCMGSQRGGRNLATKQQQQPPY